MELESLLQATLGTRYRREAAQQHGFGGIVAVGPSMNINIATRSLSGIMEPRGERLVLGVSC